jgi:uncharacterized GH25 family protein
MRSRRNGLIVIGIALAVASAPAARGHDLKVLVSRLVSQPGADETVYISYGHILPVGGQIDAATLDDYHVRTPSGSVTYLKKDGISLQANDVHLEEHGIYQAVAARRPAIWCDVVDESGNHTHHRGPRSSVTQGTVEQATRSQMFAKALLISGEDVDRVPEPLGHEIEIVPVEAPAAWRSGEDTAFRVLFQGKPLRNADLVATHIGFKPDGAWCFATATNADGIAVVRPSQAGTWVLRVKTQRPAPQEQRGEYDVESYTATLVLEVRP